MSSPIVRAIDLGYGGTKFTITDTASGSLQCGLFDSVAVEVSDVDLSSNGLMQKRDTEVVEVEGHHYEVGPDVMLANPNRSNRNLHEDYIDEPDYKALMLGALSYMEVDHIDALVLGLPVKYLSTRQDQLQSMYTGRFKVADNRTVTIDHVLVVAQPIGAFLDHAFRMNMFEQAKKETSLMVDIGFYTMDWMVAEGMKPSEHRSGGTNIGVSALLRVIGKSLSKELGRSIDNLNHLDESVRQGYYKIGQKRIDIKEHIEQANVRINEAMKSLVQGIDGSDDLDSIILTGGGAWLIERHLQERFPGHIVTTAKNSVFANVRGFQYAGEFRAKSLKTKAA